MSKCYPACCVEHSYHMDGSTVPYLSPQYVNDNFNSISAAHNDLVDRVVRLEQVLNWVEQTHPEVLHVYKCTMAATNKILGEDHGCD